MEIYNGNYCVYIHTNKINGKKYVGQTCRKPEYRWNSGKGYKDNIYFTNAIQKYGWDGFEHEVIASNLTKEEADNFEKILIQELNTMNLEFGYNLRAGGSEVVFSEESKKKMSESRIGLFAGENHPMYGKHHTEESKKKISEGSREVWADTDFQLKMSELRKQLWENENYRQKQIEVRTGKHASEETRKKQSDAMKGENNPNAKQVNQYSLDGKFIKIWDTIQLAGETLGISSSTISRCCRTGRGTAGGFKWRYASESNEQII